MFHLPTSYFIKLCRLFLLLGFIPFIIGCSSASFSTFITADNDKLMEGDEEYRFISFNIPNLLYIEDNFPFTETNPWRLPNEYEIRDALTSIKQMGGRVARTYTITVKRNSDSPNVRRHVEAPGVFYEEAFQVLDMVIKIANETKVRLIIPLVDNWWWMGGVGEYAAFRNMPREKFWTDSLIISDFKKTVEYVLNRQNTFTGKLYKDEEAILGWETGNELKSTHEWQNEIAKFIKSIDKNHLVIENVHSPIVSEKSVNDPYIDVLSTHFYEQSNSAVQKILYNSKLVKGKKPYFIGEFGFIPSYQFSEILDTVINNNVSGALLWSLRFRNRDGGFYKHYEKFGFAAYNWPGFAFNQSYSEKAVFNLIRKKAEQISGKKSTIIFKPDPPMLLETENVSKLSWQGTTGAISYVLERKEVNGNWQIIDIVYDSDISYKSLYSDSKAIKGKSYLYRMRAWNGNKLSELSNEIGPIRVEKKYIIDELFNNSQLNGYSENIKFLSIENLRKAKEERSRVTGEDGTFLIYKSDDPMTNFRMDCFKTNPESNIEIYASKDGNIFEEIKSEITSFLSGENDYGYYEPVNYKSNMPIGDYYYLKILLKKNVEISRVEIEF